MAVELFGFKIGRADEEEKKLENVKSFAPPSNDDGSVVVSEGGVFGTTVDLENTVKNESALISKYRDMSQQPEAERAIDDIVNEAIVVDESQASVELNLDNAELSENIKQTIRDEFYEILSLMKFNYKGYDIFRNWYIDGRMYYHIMIDEKNPRAGIQELRYIDPRKIKKVREPKKRDAATAQQQAGIKASEVFNKKYNEYYLYHPKGVGRQNQGIKIAPDSIAYIHSGLMDVGNATVLSHLHKALKPLNQLRMLEDATVIYRLSRAPERRIFYIDVGNLPKAKAEQYLRDMMIKHKNKLVYDANTGEVRDDRKFLTMLEDYWLPRREGGKGTEITTLPGGQNLGEIEDVLYFRKKLYESLNVPTSRLEADGQFNLGRASEITRDELKFGKFIARLRYRFSELFNILLEKQLLLKGVVTKEEWKEIKSMISYDYHEDNHFSELKNSEILRERLNTLRELDEYVGRYYSIEWVRKSVLMQTEDEIEEIDKQMAQEGEQEPQDDEEV